MGSQLISSVSFGSLSVIVYLSTTLLLVWLVHRFLQPIGRAAVCVLVLLPLLFTGEALLTGKVYGPVDLPYMSEPLKDYAPDFGVRTHNGTLSDLYCQIMPWRYAVRWAIGQGAWPLINPFMLCGDILAQSAQSAPYDPFNLVALLVPMPQSITFAAAITFFLAAFFTFVFARQLGLGELAAIVAAAVFMCCGILVFFVGWPLARAWAFLPLVLTGVRLVAGERSIRGAVTLTSGLTLVLFAGHPESILHVVAVGAAYGIFELAKRRTLRPVALACASGAIALGLSAVFILPFLDAVPQTAEGVLRRSLAEMAYPVEPAKTVRRAMLTVLPWYAGTPEDGREPTASWDPQTVRVGSVALALAAIALLRHARRRETWFFAGLLAFCTLAALSAPPVMQLLHAFPLFDITLNERFAFAAAFAFAILAGMAVDRWDAATRGTAIPAAAVLGVLGVLTVLVAPRIAASGIEATWITGQAAFELLPLAAMVALLVTRVPLRIAGPAVIGLLLLQRAGVDGSIYPTVAEKAFYPRVPVIAALPKTEEPYRVVGHHFALIPATSAFYGIEDPRGYQAMTFGRLVDTYPSWSVRQAVSFNAVGELAVPFLSMANVRYAISPDPYPPPGWRLVFRDRESSLFENLNAAGRAFVPRRIVYRPDGSQVPGEMMKAGDFREVSWMEVAGYAPHDISNGPGRVKVRELPNSYEIDAEMDGDGWVVVSTAAWKGWRAYVDGRRVSTHYANHAFVGVFVPQGRHQVRLVYLPQSFVTGRTITIATALIAGIAALVASRRRRRASAE